MTLSLANFEKRTRQAVAEFWKSRLNATEAQKLRGTIDAGSRGAVTAGKNMDGFIPLIEAIIRENGLRDGVIEQGKRIQTLPGFFRPSKRWDYVVTSGDRLIAVLEMKSQVGSFGNNFNNRREESIGSAVDFWTAFREGAFGASPHPFVGYLILVEDCEESRKERGVERSGFSVFPEFVGASYLRRFQILCQKLVAENLYSCGTLIGSPTGSHDGAYREYCEMTGMKRFVAGLAAAVSAAAAEAKYRETGKAEPQGFADPTP